MKFTIRDLLWLTVVVALGIAWWVDRGRLADSVLRWQIAYRDLLAWVSDGEWVKLGGSGAPLPPDPFEGIRPANLETGRRQNKMSKEDFDDWVGFMEKGPFGSGQTTKNGAFGAGNPRSKNREVVDEFEAMPKPADE